MLFLDRRIGESLKVGDDVTVKFLGVNKYGEAVIGIDAPPEIGIHRYEYQKKRGKQREASKSVTPEIKYKKRRNYQVSEAK